MSGDKYLYVAPTNYLSLQTEAFEIHWKECNQYENCYGIEKKNKFGFGASDSWWEIEVLKPKNAFIPIFTLVLQKGNGYCGFDELSSDTGILTKELLSGSAVWDISNKKFTFFEEHKDLLESVSDYCGLGKSDRKNLSPNFIFHIREPSGMGISPSRIANGLFSLCGVELFEGMMGALSDFESIIVYSEGSGRFYIGSLNMNNILNKIQIICENLDVMYCSIDNEQDLPSW